VGEGSKKIARMRLKSQGATWHAALLRLALEQGQHGLVAAVHAVKVAYRQGTRRRNVGMLEATENLHDLL
jgi:hypothetical protein